MISRAAAAFVLAWCTGLGACALVGGGTPGPSDAWEDAARVGTRVFGGSMTPGETRIQLRLELRGPEDALLASLDMPELEVTAWGRGAILDGRFALQLRYDGDCPGRVRVSGSVEQEGYRLEGLLVATDCTGTQESAIVLLRRPSSSAPARAARR